MRRLLLGREVFPRFQAFLDQLICKDEFCATNPVHWKKCSLFFVVDIKGDLAAVNASQGRLKPFAAFNPACSAPAAPANLASPQNP